MIVLLNLLSFFCYLFLFVQSNGNSIKLNSSTSTQSSDDYYYINYDYENNHSKSNLKSDSLIIPDPDTMLKKPVESYAVDVVPNLELPDDSLADPDLKDHNCIDNIMYVYYGSNGKKMKSYGSGIIITGAVLGCAAQLLTVFCVLLKKYYKGRKISMMLIVIHIFVTMFISNLLFMLGAYSTRHTEHCLLIAILINICHHHTAIWIFLYCLYLYKKFCRTWISIIFKNFNWYVLFAHVLPPILTTTTYYAIPNSFESKKFCFKSMNKGMIMNFMIPICILLVLTTIYAISTMIKIENIELLKLDYNQQSDESLLVLKQPETALKVKKEEFVNSISEELDNLKAARNCLKSLCVMQLLFVLNWFITPLALEASLTSTELPYLQSATSIILHWFIFFKRKALVPQITYRREGDFSSDKSEDDLLSTPTELISMPSSDSIPLLNIDGATELKEFYKITEIKDQAVDCNISTIST